MNYCNLRNVPTFREENVERMGKLNFEQKFERAYMSTQFYTSTHTHNNAHSHTRICILPYLAMQRSHLRSRKWMPKSKRITTIQRRSESELRTHRPASVAWARPSLWELKWHTYRTLTAKIVSFSFEKNIPKLLLCLCLASFGKMLHQNWKFGTSQMRFN